MHWTEEKPTKLGYYWLRDYDVRPTMVEVTRDGSVLFFGSNITFSLDTAASPRAQWYGPLEAPVMPGLGG